MNCINTCSSEGKSPIKLINGLVISCLIQQIDTSFTHTHTHDLCISAGVCVCIDRLVANGELINQPNIKLSFKNK